MRRSNCWVWARWRYWQLKRAWIRAGRPIGQEVYWVKRCSSRNRPRGFPHYFVGTLDGHTNQIAIVSFKPLVPTDEPWYLAWRHLVFRGRVAHGDWPDTLPLNQGIW